MKTSSSSLSFIEALEARLAPAGVIAVTVTAAGTLTLATVAGQDGDEVVTIDRLDDFRYQLTPGSGVALRLNGALFTTPQTVVGVTGLLANLGAGNDTVVLSDCFFSKGVTLNLGAGDNGFAMSDSTVAGPLLMTTGDGADMVSFLGDACAIGGAATFKLGGGVDGVYSSANRLGFGAGLTFDGGAGNDTLNLGYTDGDTVRVNGNLKFIGGAGNDSLSLGGMDVIVTVSGSVMLTDTAGNETVTFAGKHFDLGALSLLAGNGNNSFGSTVTDLATARNFQWASGTGQDDLTNVGNTLRVGGSLDIALGAGPGTAEVRPVDLLTVGGTAKLSATGTELVARSLIFQTTEAHFAGKVTLSAGAGNGTLGVTGGQSLYLGGGITYSAGAGNTLQSITTNGGLLCNGPLSMIQNSGNGALSVFSNFYGDTVVNGNVTLKGGDAISMQFAGTITGSLMIATSATPVNAPAISMLSNGTDGLVVAGTATIQQPSPAASGGNISLVGVAFESGLTINGGAGADTLTADNLLVLKAANVRMGAGADVVKLQANGFSGSSRFLGAVLIAGGAGADSLQLGGNTPGVNDLIFGNAVTVDGGTDADTLGVGTQVVFAPGHPLKEMNFP